MKDIEEILKLNRKLSFRVLIFNKKNLKVKIISLVPIIFSAILAIIMLQHILTEKKQIVYFFLFIPIFILLGISLIYDRNHTGKTIKKHYDYAIKKKEKWSYKTIKEIRKNELIKMLDNEILLKKDNLEFLIETVKYHKVNKHKFSFLWNVLIILSSVYLGAFLGGFVNYSENLVNYLKLYKNLGVIIGILILFIWYLDITIIKEYMESKSSKNNRLLVTLENIYIEKYAT